MPLPLALLGEAALTFAPMLLQYFNGQGGDEQAAAKIKETRDGLAARISAAEGIPLARAQALVDEKLKPLIDQHAQDSGSKGADLAAGAASAVGAAMLGRRLGGAGKIATKLEGRMPNAAEAEALFGKAAAKEAPAVAKAAAPAAEAAEEIAEGPLTARMKARDDMAARARSGELDRVSGEYDGPPRRLTYDAPDADVVEPEVIPPRRSPPNAAGMREFTIPTDQFQMMDSEPRRLGFAPPASAVPAGYDPVPSIEEILRHRAALSRLGM